MVRSWDKGTKTIDHFWHELFTARWGFLCEKIFELEDHLRFRMLCP